MVFKRQRSITQESAELADEAGRSMLECIHPACFAVQILAVGASRSSREVEETRVEDDPCQTVLILAAFETTKTLDHSLGSGFHHLRAWAAETTEESTIPMVEGRGSPEPFDRSQDFLFRWQRGVGARELLGGE